MNIKQPFLSICIPTYNRAELLGVCLTSVLNLKLTKSYEIIISDNCSGDETPQIVLQFEERGLPIRYFRNSENLGIDRNIQLAVERATGQWIHLLSDDDYLMPEYQTKLFDILEKTDRQPFIFLNHRGFKTTNLSTTWFPPRFKISEENEVFSDPVDFIDKIGVYGTLISSFVFKRDLWLRVDCGNTFINSDIYLTYAMLGYISSSRQAIFVAKPLIAVRAEYTGNYRVLKAFSRELSNAYCTFFPSLGHSKRKLHLIYSKIIVSDLCERIISIKLRSYSTLPPAESWLRELIIPQSRFPVAWFTLYPVILTPSGVWKVIRFFRKRVRTKLLSNKQAELP